MLNYKTIAAISTAQAPGGIGIVRISGEKSFEIADKVFLAAKGEKIINTTGYTALYGFVHEKNNKTKKIDEAIALVFRKPASFTGENVVEISCHGSLYVMQKLLQLVLEAGATPAGPGEFTRRAFLHGKIGLTQAEAVMQLISSQGEESAKQARAGYEGALQKKITNIKKNLIFIAAHLTAWSDYPEDNIPQLNEKLLKDQLVEIKMQLVQFLSQFDSGKVLRAGVDTVIVGKPNVGKSTLMNLLSGCDRSIVSHYAGTTRDIVEETVLLSGIPLHLSDTAGVRFTDHPVEKIGVFRTQEKMKTAELVLAVFDNSQELSEEDRNILKNLKSMRVIIVINKIDLETKLDVCEIQENFKHIVSISAQHADELKKLANEISLVLNTININPAEGILFTERQRDATRRAEENLSEAISTLEVGLTLDAVTVCVEAAISSLLELTGERVTDEVVDSVFENFCVGK